MKKFLTLALVLGIAGFASATLQFSVNGLIAPDEITLHPSDTFILDITAGGGQPGSGFMLDSTGPAMISVAQALQFVHYTGGVAKDAADYVIDLGVNGNTQSVLLDLLIPGSVVNALPDGKVVDLMNFHCQGLGDVVMVLWDTNTAEVLDTLTVHQIVPEPITMVLLGLGGLFIRKR